jgi:hypothetical protein
MLMMHLSCIVSEVTERAGAEKRDHAGGGASAQTIMNDPDYFRIG